MPGDTYLPMMVRVPLDYAPSVTISKPQIDAVPSGTERQAPRSHSEGHETAGVPWAVCLPRLVSTTVRAAHSCCQDTGFHCALRSRGTMRACFLPGARHHPSPHHTAWQPEPGSPMPCFREFRETPLVLNSAQEVLGEPWSDRSLQGNLGVGGIHLLFG